MKLSLQSMSAYPALAEEPSSIGAELSISFPQAGDLMISGKIGLTFAHENPEALSFAEVEKLAIAKVLQAMGEG